MIQDFDQKLAKLPKEVQDFLLAGYGRQLLFELMEKMDWPTSTFLPLAEAVSKVYFHELKLPSLVDYLKKNLKIDEAKAKIVACDLAGRRFLVADDYFQGAVSRLIKELGGRVEDYQDYVVKMKKAVLTGGDLEEEAPAPSVPTEKIESVQFNESDPEEEKKTAPAIFAKRIVDFLTAESAEFKAMMEEYNFLLIDLMDQDPDFRKKLEDSLYQNSQLLTKENLMIGGQAAKPTVANWLKDFISKNGSDFFSNVVLSEYLTNSENAKKLNPAEKKLLGKLLFLYRQVKFFPRTLIDVPLEQWQIIPVAGEAVVGESAPVMSGSPTSPEESKPTVSAVINEPTAGLTALEQRALEEEGEEK